MQLQSKTLLAVAMGAVTALAASACGSSAKSTSSGSASTGATGSSASGAAASPAVAAAAAFLAPYLTAPKTIGVTDKLATRPAAGKNIVFITCEDPTCTDFDTGFKAAAAQLSWKVSTLIASTADPSANNKQMLQAVALKPAAIVITGGNVPTWLQGLNAAKAAGIPVFGTSMETYPLGASTGLYASVDTAPVDRTTAGDIMGNWIVNDSDGKADVVDVTIPELKIPFYPYSQTVEKVLAKACPTTCSSDLLNIPVSDVFAGKAPAEIVSYLQSHPKVRYVDMAGGFETGVAAAIKQAGLPSVKVLDASSNAQVEAGVKDGEYAAALGYNGLMIGWYAVNAVAHKLAGGAMGDSVSPSLPTQVLTASNVGTPQNYQEPSDYQAQFRALWDVS